MLIKTQKKKNIYMLHLQALQPANTLVEFK